MAADFKKALMDATHAVLVNTVAIHLAIASHKAAIEFC